jgi:nucleotide-binding universal stress UspA family protein
MYKRIIVPLDGSKLAECALPHALQLAKGCHTEEIFLISVTEQVRGKTRAPEAFERYNASDDPGVQRAGSEITASFGRGDVPWAQRAGSEITVTFGKQEREAKSYLDRIAKKIEAEGIKVHTAVLFWPPAEAIAAYAKTNDANIIVMSSHGRSGPSRWAHSSVTDKVIRISPVPVLIVRAPGCIPTLPG